MTTAAPHDVAPSAAAIAGPSFDPEPHAAPPAAMAYRMLTGQPPSAILADDHSLDRHVLASILAIAAADGGMAPGGMAMHAGLAGAELAALAARWFPAAHPALLRPAAGHAAPGADDLADEMAMIRDLLLANCADTGDTGRWLATMIARRCMEPNHLWEDLGLRARAELTALMNRHFAPLARRNTKNMRWKRFFYRMLCEDDGFVMCATPVCTQCTDFTLCFGDESGESRMADRRRASALAAAP